MLKFLWLRRLVRRHTRPIPYKKATDWRNRFSIIYAICAWNALGWIVWELAHGRGTKEAYGIPPDELDMLSPAQQFAIKSGVQKAKIIRSSNMETIDFNIEDYQKFLPKKVEDEDDGDDEDNVA